MSPKVTEEYINQKKESIVNAAYQVCLRKPVEMVTISDVIEETGMAQGGIYRYYHDLDEILSDMIAGMRTDYNIIDQLDEVTNNKELSFEEVTHKICFILGTTMEEHLMDIQKINFDLTVLAINEPDRADKIIKGIKGREGNFEHLAKVTMPMLVEACMRDELNPKADPYKIVEFISSAYAGIEMNCILTACYGGGSMKTKCSPKDLFETLATTIILLFGGNP